jgi:hypothetical protein
MAVRIDPIIAVMMITERCCFYDVILTRFREWTLSWNRWLKYVSFRRSPLLTLIRFSAVCFEVSVTFSENSFLGITCCDMELIRTGNFCHAQRNPTSKCRVFIPLRVLCTATLVHFDIALPSTFKSSQWDLTLRFSNKYLSAFLIHPMPFPLLSPWFYYCNMV